VKISIIIPVYRESELLEGLIRDLLNDGYAPKEMLVVIDEPTRASLRLVKKYRRRVRFFVNERRLGKARALNRITPLASGDVLLFLDADLKILTPHFVTRVAQEMRRCDVMEIKRRAIRDSLIAKLASYEFLFCGFWGWFCSERLGENVGLCGAAFAIRRELFDSLGGFRREVVEDVDLGARAFLKGYSYRYANDIEVATPVHSNLRRLWEQHQRVWIGMALWFKKHYRTLYRFVRKYPSILLLTFPILLPSLALLFFNILPLLFLEKVALMAFLFLSLRLSLSLPLFIFVWIYLILRNLIGSLLAFSISAAIHYVYAWKMRCEFSLVEFWLYSLIWAPVWAVVVALSFFRVFALSRYTLTDWKV
jgi:cellulose synthase/poly-beta-1,6-N-acetylglucosamine synthase-like glycosyltransferase